MLIQGNIHRLSGEGRRVAYEVFPEFALGIPMVLMVFIQNCGFHLPVHRLIDQSLIGIAATYLVPW